jgi:hypothetical protein
MANKQGGVSRGGVGRSKTSTVSTTLSTMTSSKASLSTAKRVSCSSASSSLSVGKWACHKCTFLNRSAIAACSMCRTPWQAPSAYILAATTPVAFPLPVPQGFKVVGQDAEGFWSFQKDHARDDQPLPSFRHRLLNFTSSPNPSSSSLLSSPRACDNSNNSTKSVGAIRNSSSFVVVDNGVVIEELAVSHDKVDGFDIHSFESPCPYSFTTGTASPSSARLTCEVPCFPVREYLVAPPPPFVTWHCSCSVEIIVKRHLSNCDELSTPFLSNEFPCVLQAGIVLTMIYWFVANPQNLKHLTGVPSQAFRDSVPRATRDHRLDRRGGNLHHQEHGYFCGARAPEVLPTPGERGSV